MVKFNSSSFFWGYHMVGRLVLSGAVQLVLFVALASFAPLFVAALVAFTVAAAIGCAPSVFRLVLLAQYGRFTA